MSFLTKKKFTKLVERNLHIKGNGSYMDTIIVLCEENNMDPEDVKKYISDPIRDKIEAEASKLNLIEKQNSLY